MTEHNGYIFSADKNGTVTALGELKSEKAPRDHFDAQKNGLLMEAGDQKGHLIPARNGGPAVKENMFSQHRDLNQSTIKKAENAENRLLDQGSTIRTERIAFVSNQKKDGKARPDAFLINDTVTYKNGKTEKVNLSFANLSRADQQKIHDSLLRIAGEKAENPADTLRERMSSKEYADLMESTDRELPNLSDEFTQSHTKKEGKEMGRETFMERIRVDEATRAKLAQVAKEHAARQNTGKKGRDDGGRERGDDGPAKLGRESGNKPPTPGEKAPVISKVSAVQASLAAKASSQGKAASPGHSAGGKAPSGGHSAGGKGAAGGHGSTGGHGTGGGKGGGGHGGH